MTRPKLLLADDSVTIRKVVELTFVEEGLDVISVGTGHEAIQKLGEIQPDIVIADIHMPEPTGYQICETIKQNESTKHIPVLLVVGSFEPFDQAEAERVGADGFLTKPFQSIRDLVTRVDELLGTDKRTAPPAETADIDSLYEQSLNNGEAEDDDIKLEEFVDMVLGDAGMDDEIIEMSHPAIGMEQPEILDERVGANEAAPAVISVGSPSAVKHDRRRDDGVVIKQMRRKTDLDPSALGEPSDAFISLVARRVIEKLSDQVVREIAKEEVPRITERLMREALDEEKKS